jgi:hypothetical protein
MNNLEVLILLVIVVVLLAGLIYSQTSVSFTEGMVIIAAIALSMGKVLFNMHRPPASLETFTDGCNEFTGFPDPTNMTVFLNCLDHNSFSGSTEWRNVAPVSSVKDSFMFENPPDQSSTDRGINMKDNFLKGIYSDRLGIDNNKHLKPFTLFWYMRFNALPETPVPNQPNADPTIPIMQIFAQSPDINAVRIGYQVITNDVTRYRLVVKYGNKPEKVYENNLAQNMYQFNDQQPHLFTLVRTSSNIHLYVDKLGDLFKNEFKINDAEPIILTNREMEVNKLKMMNSQMFMLGIYRKDLSKADVDMLYEAIQQHVVRTNPVYKSLQSDYKRLQSSVDAKKKCPFNNKSTCDNCLPTLDWTDSNHVFNTAGDICKKDVREYCKGTGAKEVPCAIWKALEDDNKVCAHATPNSQLSSAQQPTIPDSISNAQLQVLLQALSGRSNLTEQEKRRLVLDLVKNTTGIETEALRIVGRELLEEQGGSVLKKTGLNNQGEQGGSVLKKTGLNNQGEQGGSVLKKTGLNNQGEQGGSILRTVGLNDPNSLQGQATNTDEGGEKPMVDSGEKDVEYDKVIAMYKKEQIEKAQRMQEMGFFRRLLYNLVGV